MSYLYACKIRLESRIDMVIGSLVYFRTDRPQNDPHVGRYGTLWEHLIL